MTIYDVFFSIDGIYIIGGKRGKMEGAVFMYKAFYSPRGKKVLFPLHLFYDGGGVDVKLQPRAELKEPLRNDVQFV